jgi:5'-phosphate synthase pdxT subunit
VAAARVGVLALQGDVSEHARALTEAGADVAEVRRPHQLDDLDGLVIPGGESTTIGRLMVEYGLMDAVRRRAGEGMAVYGSCAGLILLATDIAGSDQPRLGLMDITVQRNGFGRQRESFEAWLDVPALGPEPLEAVFIRAPYIERAGTRVDVMACSAGRIVMARQERLLGTAFHPELTADRRVHRLFVRLASGDTAVSGGSSGSGGSAAGGPGGG